MTDVFTLQPAQVPLLISFPHSGTLLTPSVQTDLLPEFRDLPDTDRHLPMLYEFAPALGVGLLEAKFSRYVVDLNRAETNQALYESFGTGLYPETSLLGEPLYLEGKGPSRSERADYLEHIWRPYHEALQAELQRLRDQFGYAILLDAHSIRSRMPSLFEGELPDLSLGTFNGLSCDPQMTLALQHECEQLPNFSFVVNGRFKGGFITRHYGQPRDHIHAVQFELVQRTYMDERPPFRYLPQKAEGTAKHLHRLIECLLRWGQQRYRQ